MPRGITRPNLRGLAQRSSTRFKGARALPSSILVQFPSFAEQRGASSRAHFRTVFSIGLRQNGIRILAITNLRRQLPACRQSSAPTGRQLRLRGGQRRFVQSGTLLTITLSWLRRPGWHLPRTGVRLPGAVAARSPLKVARFSRFWRRRRSRPALPVAAAKPPRRHGPAGSHQTSRRRPC